METDAQGNVIRKGILEDYTQHEINDILGHLTQRSGEPLVTWVVRVYDAGAAGILTDDGDAHKFGTISNDSCATGFQIQSQSPR